MTRCLTCRIRKKACPNPWISDSCPTCADLHIPCVGSGRGLPSWHKNVILVALCRRILSDQVKYRRNQNRAQMSSQRTPSVRDLVTDLINVLSSAYSFNHVAYGRDFCTITFLDETTRALGISAMECLVQDATSRLGFNLRTPRDTRGISTSEARVQSAPQPPPLPIHRLVPHSQLSHPQPNAPYIPGQLQSTGSLNDSHPQHISGVAYNLGPGMAGMSAHVGSEYTTSSVYGSGTMGPRNLTPIGPSPAQTLDSAHFISAQTRTRTHRFCPRN